MFACLISMQFLCCSWFLWRCAGRSLVHSRIDPVLGILRSTSCPAGFGSVEQHRSGLNGVSASSATGHSVRSNPSSWRETDGKGPRSKASTGNKAAREARHGGRRLRLGLPMLRRMTAFRHSDGPVHMATLGVTDRRTSICRRQPALWILTFCKPRV